MAILHPLLVKVFFNVRPFHSNIFPRGFQITKFFGHPTLGSGDKKTFKRYLKIQQTDKQTDKQTDMQTDTWTDNLHIESVGPEGRCFENNDYFRHGNRKLELHKTRPN